ncbi:MAG: Subtilase family protein, partial [uncultured Gemmatimonadetes bacterium]
ARRIAAARAHPPPAARLRVRPEPGHQAGDGAGQRDDVQGAVGAAQARAHRRVPGGGRLRSAQRVLLRARQPERRARAGAERAPPFGGEPAVPPADGVRGGDDHHRPLRAGARAQGVLDGPLPRPRHRRSAGPVRPQAAHLPARAAHGERVLQPPEGRGAVRLLSRHAGPQLGAVSGRGRVHLPVARHHRPRGDARAAGRLPQVLHGGHQPGRAGLPRGVRGHRGALPALHLSRSARPPDRPHPRRPEREREPAGPARHAVRPLARNARRAARRHRALRSGRPGVGAARAGPGGAGRDGPGARARRHPGGRGVRRVHLHLPQPHARPDAASQRRNRRPAAGRAAPGPGEPAVAGSGEVRGAGAQHLHPRAGLLPAGGPHLRRVPARPDHRRHGPDAGGPARLPGGVHRGVPAPRHLPQQRAHPLRRQPALVAPRRRSHPRAGRDREGAGDLHARDRDAHAHRGAALPAGPAGDLAADARHARGAAQGHQRAGGERGRAAAHHRARAGRLQAAGQRAGAAPRREARVPGALAAGGPAAQGRRARAQPGVRHHPAEGGDGARGARVRDPRREHAGAGPGRGAGDVRGGEGPAQQGAADAHHRLQGGAGDGRGALGHLLRPHRRAVRRAPPHRRL